MSLDVRDERLLDLLPAGPTVDRVATGFGFTEGPVWDPVTGSLTFSDIPGDALHTWSPEAGVAVLRRPSGFANGNTRDRQGRLVTCEHGTRTVSRTEPDGTRVALASRFEGKALNSPNDVVVAADGTIWFTDPTYGRMPGIGVVAESELDVRAVYRITPDGALHQEPAARDFAQPNGLALSLDGRTLYVDDTDGGHIRRFEIGAHGALTGGDVWCELVGGGDGAPDGMRLDERGNVWCTGPGGVHVIDPAGRTLGVLQAPEAPANLTWGGADRRDLFLTARTSLYRVRTTVAGAST